MAFVIHVWCIEKCRHSTTKKTNSSVRIGRFVYLYIYIISFLTQNKKLEKKTIFLKINGNGFFWH